MQRSTVSRSTAMNAAARGPACRSSLDALGLVLLLLLSLMPGFM